MRVRNKKGKQARLSPLSSIGTGVGKTPEVHQHHAAYGRLHPGLPVDRKGPPAGAEVSQKKWAEYKIGPKRRGSESATQRSLPERQRARAGTS